MERITPYQYAIFLYELTRGRSEIKKTIKSFIEVLVKNNDLGSVGEVIREFEAYERKQRGITEVELISAKPLSLAVKNQIAEIVKEHGKPEIKETVNPDLLGGITLIIGDIIIDGSLRRKVRELEKALS